MVVGINKKTGEEISNERFAVGDKILGSGEKRHFYLRRASEAVNHGTTKSGTLERISKLLNES